MRIAVPGVPALVEAGVRLIGLLISSWKEDGESAAPERDHTHRDVYSPEPGWVGVLVSSFIAVGTPRRPVRQIILTAMSVNP